MMIPQLLTNVAAMCSCTVVGIVYNLGKRTYDKIFSFRSVVPSIVMLSFNLLCVLVLLCMTCECYAQSLFDFSATNLQGEPVPMKTYESAKAILVVNVASQCGYTRGHYKELKDMYDRLKPKGLEILGKDVCV
jgi:hypothetical protein